MVIRGKFRAILAPTAGLGSALLFLAIGLFLFVVGSALSFKQVIEPFLDQIGGQSRDLLERFVVGDLDYATHLLGGLFLLFGCFFSFLGLRKAVRRLIETLNPDMRGGMVDTFVRRQRLAQGPRIVAMGGGTGLSTLLSGLKNYSSNITAIVTVTDDGGSSGKLVQEKGMIPPGDIRNCLVALADAEKAMTDLFQHRFQKGSGSLSGHSIGNLLIAALVDQANGDFEKAIEIASDVLNIRGRVVPSTLDHVQLKGLLEDGREIVGETAIVADASRIKRVSLTPPNCDPYRKAIDAIHNADLICIGPGSVYTSVIPNLLVPGIAEALRDCKAPKVYICNVMSQPGESDRFTASEHAIAVQVHVDMRVFDYVLVNTAMPTTTLLGKYQASGQHIVEPDVDVIRTMGYRTLTGNFLNETDVLRHDAARVAAKLVQLAERARSQS